MCANISMPDGLRKTVQLYFDGLYASDTALLEQAFHPAATICGYGGDGSLKALSLPQFLAFAASIPSAAAKGGEFDMEVLSCEQTGPVAAVKTRDLYMGRDFTDYLHLIETQDGWRIVGKAFHCAARAA